MKKTRITAAVLSLLMAGQLAVSMTACTEDPAGENPPRETFPQETFIPMENTAMTFRDGLDMTAYAEDTPEGAWLAGCSAPDRNDHLDAYVLRHESAADGHTTFTYLVYYPHGGQSMEAAPALLQGESGYAIHLTYEAGQGSSGYSLCYLSVTLPTDRAPELELRVDKKILGMISTVTQTPIQP